MAKWTALFFIYIFGRRIRSLLRPNNCTDFFILILKHTLILGVKESYHHVTRYKAFCWKFIHTAVVVRTACIWIAVGFGCAPCDFFDIFFVIYFTAAVDIFYDTRTGSRARSEVVARLRVGCSNNSAIITPSAQGAREGDQGRETFNGETTTQQQLAVTCDLTWPRQAHLLYKACPHVPLLLYTAGSN